MESFKEKLQKTAERLGVKLEQMPRHIAIIMDGNGRWAQKKVFRELRDITRVEKQSKL